LHDLPGRGKLVEEQKKRCFLINKEDLAMTNRHLIPAWIGILLLSGLFLTGQDTWPGPGCIDEDGDGYGSIVSAQCTYPELDCNDQDAAVHPGAPELCDGIDNQCPGDARHGQIDEGCASYRITDVLVEDGTTYRLMNPLFPQNTGDLWPCAWGADDRLYVSAGDGFGFGLLPVDIVCGVVDGHPPELTGHSLPGAVGRRVSGLWDPGLSQVNRKPTGMVCVDGDLYLFAHNLKHGLSDNPFGDAPTASLSRSSDGGRTWFYEPSAPMFSDHVFTTGFFLDYGRCQEYAQDEYVYVYGLDYNYRYSDGFDQTRLFLARVPDDRILDREAWEFFTGLAGGLPAWSPDIADRDPVLEDDTLYTSGKSGIAQGSVVYIPTLNRYLYSTRALYEWIFYEAAAPWGPWTKVAVAKWTGGWREDFHAGYNVVIPTKFLDADGRGGWTISSLSNSWFDGMYYNMNMRRFTLEVEAVAAEKDSEE